MLGIIMSDFHAFSHVDLRISCYRIIILLMRKLRYKEIVFCPRSHSFIVLEPRSRDPALIHWEHKTHIVVTVLPPNDYGLR